MIWESASNYSNVADWRCHECGEKCVKVGIPQIRIQSLYVRGGELLTFECRSGHRQQIEDL